MEVENSPATSGEEGSSPGMTRRAFVTTSRKALYVAPTLTLLASVRATAALPSEPPPPPGSAPVAPAPPGP